ncbi:NADH-quinone oxidoreductase subunit NuoE [Aurantimonas sp. VKM B-3413]|uniref:NADH-quinone oxidoreductase subunit NuoE n=1 Tax=Aurantimonas sp. VKM B-3413 TaxID=2779401 RepID=UPI001E601335|nr:NADH-quinone oxidoreductase subunit NuoE [Aurantimonas sp. VKM B-3413]MCB8838506.1 NADH-quinone oxidoreductase subunit NuoE [Aurantimonas sp. VKM B-3413]
MSVRRLAEDAVQPTGFMFSEENAAWAEMTIRKYPEGRQQSAVIPLLMRAQDQDGWVTKAAIEHVADMLKMPLIRVLEVATFYTQFQLKPVGTKAHVQVCGTTPCMLRGSEDLKAVCRKKIHAEPFHRNEAGTLSWEEVECLGACVNAPMVMIFQDTYEDLTPERLEEIIDLFEAGRAEEVKPGPQNGRHLSAPIGGLTSLTGDYDDIIETQRREAGHGPADGAPPQGEGGGAAATPPSKAGRPDTDAPETDPAIAAPGKAQDGNAVEAGEREESDELTAEAHAPAAGQTGGTQQGETGEAERDALEVGQVSGDSPAADAQATGGDLRAKEAAAEAAVIPESHQVDDALNPDHSRPQPGGGYDRAGTDQAGVDEVEGRRRQTSDETPGPVIRDHFASEAEEVQEESEPGEKPADLLDGPQGEPDDLKEIRGIGPVIEGKLNELGVFHFWQIAKWREVELIWIDNYLNFRGRAVREGWIEQAKELEKRPSAGGGA